jgi:predicted SnoaL-like aldol condensation-catalyzing enzyme
MERQMTAKEKARRFLELASAGNSVEAFDAFVAPAFLHHNPYFDGSAETLMAAMAENAKEFPDKVLEIKTVIQEGPLVAVHARVRLSPESPDIVLIHIFRFQNNKIVELWEAAQQIPEDSPNRNGVF